MTYKEKDEFLQAASPLTSNNNVSIKSKICELQKTRLFWKPAEKIRYQAGNLIPPESGCSSLEEPVREFKLFSLESNRLEDIEKPFIERLAKFASACLNTRVNGTIYFGIADAKDGRYKHGEVVGMNTSIRGAFKVKSANFVMVSKRIGELQTKSAF